MNKLDCKGQAENLPLQFQSAGGNDFEGRNRFL